MTSDLIIPLLRLRYIQCKTCFIVKLPGSRKRSEPPEVSSKGAPPPSLLLETRFSSDMFSLPELSPYMIPLIASTELEKSKTENRSDGRMFVTLVIALTGHVITFYFGQINEKMDLNWLLSSPSIWIEFCFFMLNLPRQRRKDSSKGMWKDEDQCSFGLSGLVLISWRGTYGCFREIHKVTPF